MRFDKVLLQFVLVLCTLKLAVANISAGDVYSILAEKIDVMHNEMSFLRRVVMSTKSELSSTKSELTSYKSELTSTKSELASTKADLESTRSEVKKIRMECGLVENNNKQTTPSVVEFTNSTTFNPEEPSCCALVKSSIMAMKVHQKHIKQSMTKVKNDVFVLSKNLKSIAQHMKNELNDVKGEAKNITIVQVKQKRNLAKISQNLHKFSMNQKEISTKVEDQHKTFTKVMQNATRNLVKTNTEIEQLSEDLNELSINHDLLDKKVISQMSQVKEMDKAEHCQSGIFGAHSSPNSPFPKTFKIVFQKPFAKKPTFSFGVVILDFGHKTNMRLGSFVTELSESMVKVTVKTWNDTDFYGAKFSWMACPT